MTWRRARRAGDGRSTRRPDGRRRAGRPQGAAGDGRRGVQDEAEKALQEVIADISKLRQDRKTITPEAYAKAKRRYEVVMGRASEYARTLSVNQTRTAAAAEIALEALHMLQDAMINAGTS